MDDNKILEFPPNFHFGSSTAAYQVEGNTGEHKNDWDNFVKNNPGIIKPGENGPEWWMRGKAEEDLTAMADLGLKIQRLSIAWGRIEPEKGVINYSAIKRYKEIIKKIFDLGMSPMVTLNHYVLPEWVVREGSWEAKHIALYFERYTELIVSEFPEVTHWVTLNEPNILVILAYFTSYFPPQKGNIFSAIKARHNMIEAHNRSYHMIKSKNPNSKVGVAFSFRLDRPQNPLDPFELLYTKAINYFSEMGYVDSLVKHSDFIGCNYYTSYFINFDILNIKLSVHLKRHRIPKTILFGEVIDPHTFESDYGWPIMPDFLLNILRYLNKKYKLPIIITENGIADHTDRYRALYILTHLVAVWQALQEGITVKHYIHWSTVDNLEWIEGYSKKFGLLALDQATGKRTLRKSAHLYGEIAKSGKIDIDHLIEKYITEENQKKSAESMIKKLIQGKLTYETEFR